MPSSSSTPTIPCPFIDSVTPGGCVSAGVRVGDNSLTGTNPGAFVGASATNRSTAEVQWDSNLADNFDSWWVSVQLIAQSGSVSFSLNQPNGTVTSLTYSGVTFGTISGVQISSAVSSHNVKITWQSVLVEFYRDGTVVDATSLASECNPAADTTPPNSPISVLEVSELTPSTGGITKVVVTGQVRLQSPFTTLPAPDAITGQIYVFADNCATT